LDCLTDLDEGGTLVGKFAYQDAPSPGVVIKDELLRLPLIGSELERITQDEKRMENSPVFEFGVKKVRAYDLTAV